MANMDLIGHSANATGFIVTSGGGAYHFYSLQMTNNYQRSITPGAGDAFCLIELCRFEHNASAGSFNDISGQGNGQYSWTNASSMGTLSNNFIQYCYFKENHGNGGNGFIDAYDGAQLVIRFNTFDGGTYMGTHGYDSQAWSTRNVEYYGNINTNHDLNHPSFLIRGGGLMAFSNTTYMAGAMVNSPVGYNLQYYRGADSSYQGHFGYAGRQITYANTGTDHPYRFSSNFTDGQTVAVGHLDIGYYYMVNSLSGQPGMRVLIGANLAESLTNLSYAINMDPTKVGTKYTSGTVSNSNFQVLSIASGTDLVMTNLMDGLGFHGYPAAMQPGLRKQTKASPALPTDIFPCYSWSNLCYAAGSFQQANIVVQWSGDGSYVPNYLDDLLVAGRDLTNNAIPPTNLYQPFGWHPLSILPPPNAVFGTQEKPIGRIPFRK